MSNATDMTTPVTRGEVSEEIQRAIAPLATKAELAAAIAPLATKVELEVWGGALLARIESSERKLTQLFERSDHRIDQLDQRMTQMDQRWEKRLQEQLAGLEQRLSAQFASHAKAIHESAAAMIAGLDDKYKDLPGRVKRLEVTVFPPK